MSVYMCICVDVWAHPWAINHNWSEAVLKIINHIHKFHSFLVSFYIAPAIDMDGSAHSKGISTNGDSVLAGYFKYWALNAC